MSKVSITRSLLDDLAMSISAKSGEPVPMTLTEMKDAVDNIQTGGGGGGGDITVEALSVTQNGTYTAQTGHAYSPVTVNVSGIQESTGTVTGDGTIVLQVPCAFEPKVIYVYGDLSGDITLRGIVTFSLIKDMDIYVVSDTSSSGVSEAVVYGTHGISGYNDSSNPHATYSNGILTLDNVTNSSSLRFASGVTYNYNLIGW